MSHQITTREWNQLTLCQQLGNIGSEVSRALKWKEKGNVTYSQESFFRALELLDLSKNPDYKTDSQLQELCRLKEVLGDYFVGDNTFKSSAELWKKYFDAFAYAANVNKL